MLEAAEVLLIGQVIQEDLGDQAEAETHLTTLLKDKSHKLELMDAVAAEADPADKKVEAEGLF